MLFAEWHQLEAMFLAARVYYEEKLLPLIN
jgi:hypothetical protein